MRTVYLRIAPNTIAVAALDVWAASGHVGRPMAIPWLVLDRSDTPEGALELRRRGDDDFLLTLGTRVLMNSRASRSEIALARLGCGHLAGARQPSVLIGGLGLGYTLRAALDVLPAGARVTVAEIDPLIVRWYRSHFAHLSREALDDPRVDLRIEDVAATVARAAEGGDEARYDAILFDLYEGPSPDAARHDRGPFGAEMLRRVRGALREAGVFALWSEQPSPVFETRLRAAGFAVTRQRPGRGGLRHAVYVARPERPSRRRDGDRARPRRGVAAR